MVPSWWHRLMTSPSPRQTRRRPAWLHRRTLPLSFERLEDRVLLDATVTFTAPLWPNSPGPVNIAGGQVLLPTPASGAAHSVAGAINAIAVNPLNAKNVFVGTVNGGV